MIAEIKAEAKKVLTIRSTYTILGFMLALVIFFGFYVGGWHSAKIDLLDPHRLYRITQQSIAFLSQFMALIGVLLLTHEWRHNTIAHTLTLSNSRNKVLIAKIIVISILAIVVTAVTGILAPLLSNLGIHANHLHLVHQSFYYKDIIWRGLAYGVGYAMVGLALALLIRNQIGAIVTLLIVPGPVEGILSIWLKNNTDYLPFSALHTMLGAGLDSSQSSLSPVHALYVVLVYLVVGWGIGWYLFLTRDAI
jgi:ABC-type transport system involved in multi-copper enzyme maturation permease subunit